MNMTLEKDSTDKEIYDQVEKELIKKLTNSDDRFKVLDMLMNTKVDEGRIDEILTTWPRQGSNSKTTEIAFNEEVFSTLIRNAPRKESDKNKKIITKYTKDTFPDEYEEDALTEDYRCIENLVKKYPNPQNFENILLEISKENPTFTKEEVTTLLKTIYGARYYAYQVMHTFREDYLRTAYIN